MERLGQTVKRHFEHFIHISFVYLGKLERRSRPSPFTVQFVVVVSFDVDASGPFWMSERTRDE